MPDQSQHYVGHIFVSYAREDQTRILPLIRAFEERGWAIFWDRRIPAGQTWRSYIEKALNESNVVVVVWTRHSVASNWVVEEAEEGKRRGILVPVLLEPVEIPMGFRSIQVADLEGWDGDNRSPSFTSLTTDIETILHASEGQVAVAPRQQESSSKPGIYPWVTGRSLRWVALFALTVSTIFLGYFLLLPPHVRTDLLTSETVNKPIQGASHGTEGAPEWQLSPDRSAQSSQVTVDIYTHDAGLTRIDAEILQKKLLEQGIQSSSLLKNPSRSRSRCAFLFSSRGGRDARNV